MPKHKNKAYDLGFNSKPNELPPYMKRGAKLWTEWWKGREAAGLMKGDKESKINNEIKQ